MNPETPAHSSRRQSFVPLAACMAARQRLHLPSALGTLAGPCTSVLRGWQVLLLLCGLLPHGVRGAEPPDPRNFRDPDAVKRVSGGKEETANAAWWGFDPLDATDAIHGAINSGARKVIIPYVGRDWIVRPLTLASNQEIVIEPGVVLVAKRGEFRGKQDSLFQGIGVHDVTLRGYGAVLRMRKADYLGQGYSKSEFRHVLVLKGASNITVEGLTLENSGGDGIYVGPTWDADRVPCRFITIRDCLCRNNHRQGISVVSAEHVSIDNCRLTGTRGTPPQAGIDLEPSSYLDRMADIRVSRCISEDNAGSGFIVSIGRLNSHSNDVSVLFDNCLARDCEGLGMQLRTGDDPPRGLVEFRRCTWERFKYAGVFMICQSAPENLLLRFRDCKWRDVAQRYKKGLLYMELHDRAKLSATGGIEFVNCYLYDTRKRHFLNVVPPEDGKGIFDVRGEIHVINPAGSIEPLEKARLKGLRINYHTEQR